MYLLPILRQQNYYRIGKMSGKNARSTKSTQNWRPPKVLCSREKSSNYYRIRDWTLTIRLFGFRHWRKTTNGRGRKEALKVLSAENLNSKAFKSDSMGSLTNRRFSHLEAVDISRQVRRKIGQNENWSRSPPPGFMMCHERLTYFV